MLQLNTVSVVDDDHGGALAGFALAECLAGLQGSGLANCARRLTTDKPLTMGIGNKAVTTLQFPRPLQGIFGYGLTTGEVPGTYHYAHPQASRVLALRNLMPDKETFLTVLLDAEDLYVLHLKPTNDPAVLVRLSESSGTAASLSAVRPVDAESLAKRRLDHSTARLFNLLKLGKNARTFRVAVPHLYEDVESRTVSYRRDDGKVATVVTKLHRFPKEDALFIDARIENQSDTAIYFDPGSVQVKVGSRTYPTALVDAASEVPAGGRIALHAIVRGGLEGERAHLSIKNAVQLIMAAYAATPDDQPTVNVSLQLERRYAYRSSGFRLLPQLPAWL